jgi:hypothetical protein
MGFRQSELLVKSNFITDGDGNPTGGVTTLELDQGEGYMKSAFHISWQDGIVGDDGQTGAFMEDVLEAARQRLQFFQTSKFRCRENAIALTKLEEALQWLDWRTRKRLIENVENSYEVHTE